MVVLRKDALKDEIVSILSNNAFKDKLYSFKEIKKKLACNVSVGDLQEMLDDLEKEGRIVINNRGQYRVFSSELGYVQGRIFIDELGNGYVEEVADIQGEQVKITYKVYTEDLNDSLNGDLVLLKTTGGSSKGHVLAKVEKVIQRHSNLVFGTVIEENGELALAPEPHNFKHKILLKKKDKTVLNPGQRVLVDIGELVDDRYYLASICRVDVRKEDSKETLHEEKKQQEYLDASILCEREVTIHIDEYMNGVVYLRNGEKAIIDPAHLHDALEGDVATVQVLNVKRNGNYVGEVINIVERKNRPIICDTKRGKNGRIELIPCGLPFKQPIVLDYKSTNKLLVEGDRIQVILGEYDKDEKAVIAKYDSFVGNKNNAYLDLRTIAIEHNIDPEFTPESLAEAETIPQEVTEKDLEGRLDLRDELIFTIDDETCKDRDDAISIKRLPNGNFQAGIHISDVSHYIKPGMALWEEAKRKSTSTYIGNVVFAMLPKIISNGICSLDEGKDRLTLSTIVEVTPEGKIVNYKFVDSVINSKKAMTYTAVNQILEEGIVPEGYEDFVESLKMWDELSKVLEKRKLERGYIDLGSSEIKTDYDDNGNVVAIHPRVCGSGQKLIENGMLLNGQCYAEYMKDMPAPFRVHDEPDEEKLEGALDVLGKSGIKVVNSEKIIDGRQIEQIIKSIKDEEVRQVASNILLRAMMLARDDVEPGYHFGLGLDIYGQFTSPIRRFMDLLAHYLLKLKRDKKFNWSEYNKIKKDVEEMCKHSTMMERRSDAASRDGDRYAMISYVGQHMDDKYPAQVTYINSSGIYIKTREGIDGKIHKVDVEGLHLMYDEPSASYKDKKRGITIRIGDRLIATPVSTAYKTIHFGIAEEDSDSIKKLTRKRA